MTEEHFDRPGDFDLVAFWQKWCTDAEANQSSHPVTVRIARESIPLLHNLLALYWSPPDPQPPPDASGRVSMILSFEKLEQAGSRLLSLGRELEVLESAVLRRSTIDHATQTLSLHQGRL
jgi:hypothetical protein